MAIVRYRFRAYPTEGQVQKFARTFGCARVVYNDCVRLRRDANARGDNLSDAEIQRRVVTLAKQTREREWLGEVASVALKLACQDARRAHRNWFASLAERRKGRRVGPPRFKSRKDRRQSVRLTRNGFALRPNGRVYVAKVGDLRVEWPRLLPSASSSCTVIREADGRYYVSFVVKRDPVRLPPVEGEVGIGLGLDGPKPLAVRARTCAECGAEHDRDLNAARNVLTEGRRIAAGLAEIENASLSGRQTGSGPAVCVEAGTRLGRLA